MASSTKVSILDYFNIVFEGENGKIESNCKACGTRIQAKRSVTSNFVTHLKRKHQAMYDEFVRKKDVKREACASAAALPGTPRPESTRSPPGGGGLVRFERNDPRQLLISEAIAKMIVRDLQSVHIVENEGFRELLRLLEPRYTPESRLCLQKQLLPGYAYQVQLAARQALAAAEACSISVDLWTPGTGLSGYLGVTCHFIASDWHVQSVLLACLPLVGRSPGQQVALECEEICRTHGIGGKVFRVVADSACRGGCHAFSLPGICLHAGEQQQEEEEEDEQGVADGSDEDVQPSEAGQWDEGNESLDLCFGSRRVSCFARLLRRCVREGLLRASPQLSLALSKAACLYNHATTAVAPDKLRRALGVDGPVLVDVAWRQRDWSLQLKAVRRLLDSADFLEDVVERQDLALGSMEKAMLRELLDVLEPFEEAADMVQGDKHVSLSLALPCVLGLRKHLSEASTRHCSAMLADLAQALERRLAGILEQPLYVAAAALDPQFKLTWSGDGERHRQVLLRELAEHVRPEPCSQESGPPPYKRSRLFSFIKQRPALQAKSVEQELHTYLMEEPTDEEPLHYWQRKATDFPQLSQVAKKLFTIPATTTPVEGIFRSAGKMLSPERCKLWPKNLETLIYLKANYKLLWS